MNRGSDEYVGVPFVPYFEADISLAEVVVERTVRLMIRCCVDLSTHGDIAFAQPRSEATVELNNISFAVLSSAALN